MSDRHVIRCPGCQSELIVDAQTGQILHHREDSTPAAGGATFESLFDQMDENRARAEALFEQEKTALDQRERILEEKFDEALKRAEEDPDPKPPPRPWDLD